MILIDRDKSEQAIIVTLDGITPDGILYLKHDAERSEFDIDLGIDVSEYVTRYARFNVPTEDFIGMPEGFYSYHIVNVLDGSIIEEGKLFIKPSEAIQVPTAPDLSNTYKVFTK